MPPFRIKAADFNLKCVKDQDKGGVMVLWSTLLLGAQEVVLKSCHCQFVFWHPKKSPIYVAREMLGLGMRLAKVVVRERAVKVSSNQSLT